MSETKVERAIRLGNRRKTTNHQCEMYVGWDEDQTGKPVVKRCGLTESKFFPEFGMWGMYLCGEHFETQIGRENEHRAHYSGS